MPNWSQRIAAAAMLLALCFSTLLCSGEDRPVVDATKVQGEVSEFLSLKDYHRLEAIVRRWNDLPNKEFKKSIVVSLLAALKTHQKVGLENFDDLFIDSRINSGETPFPGHGYHCRQDLFLQSGRAAWAIERIVTCELPQITEEGSRDEKERAKVFEESYLRVIKRLAQP